MTKNKFHDSIKIATIKRLKESKFSFVNNKILQENLAMKMQHIIFLFSVEKSYELPGAIQYSVLQTMIVFTASIVEGLIHYKLAELIESNKVQEHQIMGKEEKFSNLKELYKISDSEKILGVKQVIKSKALSDDTNFFELNKAAKRSGLFTEELFQHAEKIRQTRNRMHPYSLKEVDDKYSKEDINNIFAMAAKIIERIEKY